MIDLERDKDLVIGFLKTVGEFIVRHAEEVVNTSPFAQPTIRRNVNKPTFEVRLDHYDTI